MYKKYKEWLKFLPIAETKQIIPFIVYPALDESSDLIACYD